jgi:hypothetical protein
MLRKLQLSFSASRFRVNSGVDWPVGVAWGVSMREPDQKNANS